MTDAPPATRPETPTGPLVLPVRTHRQRSGPAIRTTSLVLGAVDTAAGCARATVRDCLAQWRLHRLADDAEAITSELVANAVSAARNAAPDGGAAPVTLSLSVQQAELCIRVQDPDPTPPPRPWQAPGDDAEHGRGLLIVDALADRWAWYPAPGGGKFVWAALLIGPLPAQVAQ
jgi:anti-sigma regulatory factor (Ser/Thr protein kinase)